MSTQVATLEHRPLEVQRGDIGASILDVIARAASDPSVDITKMQALLDMQERVMLKQAEAAFNQAMTRLQPRLPVITKKGKIEFRDKTGNAQSTPFARYEDIDEAIRPLLCDEGFSLSFDSEPTDKGILYHGTLAHAMGHSRRASMVLPADTSGSKNSIQAIGSTISYSKRYLVGMLLNIVTRGADDDAQSVGFLDDRQVGTVLDMIAACDMDPASTSKFLEYAGAKAVSEIAKRDYARVIQALQVKLRKRREGGK